MSVFDSVWLEPQFYVNVSLDRDDPRGPCVVLQSGEAMLRGSEWIDNINQRVQFKGTTRLWWQDSNPGPHKIISETKIEALADPPMPVSLIPKPIIKQTVETIIKVRIELDPARPPCSPHSIALPAASCRGSWSSCRPPSSRTSAGTTSGGPRMHPTVPSVPQPATRTAAP